MLAEDELHRRRCSAPLREPGQVMMLLREVAPDEETAQRLFGLWMLENENVERQSDDIGY